MTEKTKAILKIAGIVVVFVLLIVGTILYKSWWLKVPCGILAIGLGWLLVRMYLSYKRKKYAIEGKVLSITSPKNKFKLGKYTVIVKTGKSSKKLYSWQKLSMKVGNSYAIYYEEKSNQIIKYESMKINMAARPKGNLPPQFR
ncbi:MAG: hypothetical protein WBH44_04720 [Proteocatella sp.]